MSKSAVDMYSNSLADTVCTLFCQCVTTPLDIPTESGDRGQTNLLGTVDQEEAGAASESE